jgi:hypothetical protein
MAEPRIGRVLVASLHQAIADLLPTRLEFYENWLSTSGLRQGTIGLAPLNAVLSFLRLEGDAYHLITARAGEYAAAHVVEALPAVERALVRALPGPVRAHGAFWLIPGMIRATYGGTRAVVRLRRGVGTVDIRGSLFCIVREMPAMPLCGFYAAAVARLLELFGVTADARVSTCRACGGTACVIAVAIDAAREAREEVVAA